MTILTETAKLVEERLGADFETLAIDRLVVGLFFTGIKLSNGAGGISFTPIKEIPDAVCCPTSAGKIFHPLKTRGMKAKDVLKGLSSQEPLKVSAAIATLNALSSYCLSRGWENKYHIKMKMDATDVLTIPEGGSVAVVGAMVPVIQKLKRHSVTWWVIEKDSRTLKADELAHFIPINRTEEIICKADMIIATGVTLINHTLENILQAANPDAEIIVLGPTASMLPDSMFQRGVNLVGGVWVKKTDQLLDVLSAGGSGYHFFDSLADRIVFTQPN